MVLSVQVRGRAPTHETKESENMTEDQVRVVVAEATDKVLEKFGESSTLVSALIQRDLMETIVAYSLSVAPDMAKRIKEFQEGTTE